ncbi:hypothetical protein ACWGH3_03950 [Streptomyces sp. NPDC054884]|uniref:hypothetical protein n=1 Tax=Streptomyces sp. ME08-AFT2 TaxID=3028683 RepID=UPI0029A8A274|nr:hypothetical protein [Streptomyces sp. ME08-AFT2]MDX3308229.1 hypothetical protein [Streptomyces sp. ME08-AFT2]
MGRHFVQAGIAAGAALLLTACGGGAVEDGKAETGGGKKKAADTTAASLAQKDSLTVAWCHKIPQGEDDVLYGLTLRSYSTKDGSVVAERQTVLPAEVVPETVCETDDDGVGASYAFNKDFSMVAGIYDPDSKKRAGAYGLSSGQEVSPPPADEFAERPENMGVAFHPTTGLLWAKQGIYDEITYGVRDAKKGYSTEKTLSTAEALSQDAATTATVQAARGNPIPVTPNGSVKAYWSDNDIADGIGLSRIMPDGEDEGIETKQDKLGLRCTPAFWRTNTSLVCGLRQITFTADYTSVVKDEELVPANDRSNSAPVPSPDGKGFAFISESEDRLGLFRADFTSGGTAQPVKIADLETPLDGASNHVETLVRWN